MELIDKEIEYLKSKNVTVDYEFIEFHHFLIDGTYKKLATVLELKENTYCIRGTVKGFSTISSNKVKVDKDGSIQCKVDFLKLLTEMDEKEEKEFLEIFIKLANKYGLKYKI